MKQSSREMSSDPTAAFNTLLLGKIRIDSPMEELRRSYASAKPFSHLVIDGLFSTQLLDDLILEMAAMRPDQWSLINQDARERTLRMRSAAEMGPVGGRLLSIVHTAAFLFFISEITGIGQLLPDPYLRGGGYASMRRGDYFNVHSDRNVAYDSGLTRRLAMIVYLNKDWDPAYAGQLELWNDEATRCEVSIDPLYNRTIIFEVAHPNFHGVPAALECPGDRARQSFIVYYHTAGVDENSSIKPHSSVFAPRLHGTNRMTFKSVMRDITPPIVLRGVRRLLASIR